MKMQTRLASWKNKLLNRPGKLALASSVLSSIPTYYMQINWLPQSLCESIDQTTRNFIWKGANDKGVHLVGWKKIAKPKHLGGLGIRTAREANTCLLGNLVWDLIQNNNKLWVNLFMNKYSAGPSLLHASITASSSPTWSSIIRAKNVLKSGYSWRAGSGTSSFWFSSWSVFGPIGSLVPVIDIHDLHLTVKDVITRSGKRSQLLYTSLPPAVSDFINNSNLRFNDAVDDGFIWHHNQNGVYSTKSGYNWLLSFQEDHLVILSWSWIWRQKLPKKFKFFIWLACHNSIPTLSLLHHRNIAPSATCTRCGDFDETVFHCIHDCRFSKHIWQHLGFSDSSFFLADSVRNWILDELNGLRAILLAASMWWVWRYCNSMCLNTKTIHHSRLMSQIHTAAENINRSYY